VNDQKAAQRLAYNLDLDMGENDDDDDDEDYHHVEHCKQDMLFPVIETLEQQRYICEVLAPFASTYVAVAQALQILHRSSMLESEFINFVINDLSNKVKNGSCPYGKCCNTQPKL